MRVLLRRGERRREIHIAHRSVPQESVLVDIKLVLPVAVDALPVDADELRDHGEAAWG